MVDSLLNDLRQYLGPEGFTDNSADLSPWLTDWRGRVTGKALAMLSPATVAEVQAIIRFAADARIALVPQGGNTSMVGGATPDESGQAAILSLRRLNRIRSIDRTAHLLVAEAGVILEDVHNAAMAEGCLFPLSLAAKGSATIGGLVSTNAGGVHVVRYGTMRALTCGIEAVLPDGSLYNGLAALRKDNRGYDLRQLLIGSEGTLGVITAATLSLVPQPVQTVTAWAALSNIAAALPLFNRLQQATAGQVAAFELIPGIGLELIRDTLATQMTMPVAGQHSWHVLFEVETSWDRFDIAAEVTQQLAAAISEGLVADATIAASLGQAAALWAIRESLPVAERTEGPAAKHDIAVVPEDMPQFITEMTQSVESKFPGARVLAFGHLGDGNVHFNVRPPKQEGGSTRAIEDLGASAAKLWLDKHMEAIHQHVHDAVAARGGTLSAEHGIGVFKRDEFARLAGAEQLRWMRGVKAAFDPLNIMNPGKLLPPCT